MINFDRQITRRKFLNQDNEAVLSESFNLDARVVNFIVETNPGHIIIVLGKTRKKVSEKGYEELIRAWNDDEHAQRIVDYINKGVNGPGSQKSAVPNFNVRPTGSATRGSL